MKVSSKFCGLIERCAFQSLVKYLPVEWDFQAADWKFHWIWTMSKSGPLTCGSWHWVHPRARTCWWTPLLQRTSITWLNLKLSLQTRYLAWDVWESGEHFFLWMDNQSSEVGGVKGLTEDINQNLWNKLSVTKGKGNWMYSHCRERELVRSCLCVFTRRQGYLAPQFNECRGCMGPVLTTWAFACARQGSKWHFSGSQISLGEEQWSPPKTDAATNAVFPTLMLRLPRSSLRTGCRRARLVMSIAY